MGQVQDSHLSRGPWYEGNFFNDPGRRFETVYNNGLPHKRSGEAYLSSSYAFLPLVRRTEDDRPCMPCLIENNNTNGLRLGDEDTRCSEGSDSDCYYTKETIERLSPSRRDGIDLQKETFLRCSYVSFLQTLGMQLQLPQTTIATAIVLCHRFFLRRSHASNDRFLIATACIFLAAKSEETSRPLNNVLVMSYQMCHEQDLSSFHYLLPNDWFEQYRQCVIEAEHTLLTTLDFELTVQHAYRPLMSVLSKIGLAHTTLLNLAWNFINEGLRGSLCLQFKPHHIAAGAVSLASKVLNFDLSTTPSLWQEFQTTSTIIQDVVKQLTELS